LAEAVPLIIQQKTKNKGFEEFFIKGSTESIDPSIYFCQRQMEQTKIDTKISKKSYTLSLFTFLLISTKVIDFVSLDSMNLFRIWLGRKAFPSLVNND
jgi:hypothetical protein